MKSPGLVLLVTLVSSAVAVPLSRKERCARHCTESSRFNFSPGSTYTYDYETLTTTTVTGTNSERSQLQMRAQVDIEVISKCELSIRLRGVTLKQSDPHSPDYLSPIKGGREFSRAVERHSLHFSYQDGVVEEVCPSAEAEPWVTNIQRGVLSAFQNSMQNLDGNERLIETDVSGKCPVEYMSLGRNWRGTLTIRKVKDLNTCTHRENTDTSLQGTPFSHGSSIQSRPLVRGKQECDQSIGSGILQSSSCSEKLVFRPFSNRDGGATTDVRQKLTYATVSTKSFTGNDYRLLREHLLYNHEKEGEAEDLASKLADQALVELCEASADEMDISVPRKFASFVYTMKKLDYDDLGSLFRRADKLCPNNSKAKKFFMDAIPIVATSSSVKFLADMVTRQEVTESEANFWFTSLSFISKPTTEMIRFLTPLLDGPYEQAYLGVSSLAYTFCKENDCSNIPDVRAVVYKLADNLGENCFNLQTRKILLSLKALGNIGIPYGREKILERCAMNPQLKKEVRIAAIQTFRRFSCDISLDTFMNAFTNYNEDNEMRIASYLALMKCPDASKLQTIRETLSKEQVNQVGSFVWTHLQALAKSRHPERQNVRDILSNLYLMNKYNSDIKKFSSAHEASLYLESIDSGLHVDTHLVFPTHSYLPHSAMFNLTVDIFGHSCNLLQLDGRLEGMERVMERFFGPSGYFPQKHITKLLREKRSTESKINKMDREFDVGKDFEDTPYGSLDMKIFGNTLWYSQFQESKDGESSINIMDIIADLAEEKTKEYSRSFMFLDTSYSIPMTSGLPLRFAVNGTASVGLKLGGKFDVRSFQNVDVVALFEPSGTVEIAGLLTVEAGSTSRTGLRIAATLHSSSMLDTKVEVRNGRLVKVHVNMPKERIDIVNVQTKLYLLYGNEEKEKVSSKQEGYHYDSCTGDYLQKLLGIEMCSQINLPAGEKNSILYPMNGGASLNIFIRKTDKKLTKYTFDASWEKRMIKKHTVQDGVISLNTPGSIIDREVSLKYYYSDQDNSLRVDMKTPLKKFGLKAKFANDKTHKKLDVSSTVDDSELFSARGELRQTAENQGHSYYPSLEVHLQSKRILSLLGSAHVRQGVKYGAQLTMKDVTEKPIVLKGSMDIKNEGERYEGEIGISSFAVDATMKGFTQLGDNIYTKVNAEYRIMESKQNKASINAKVRNLSANSLSKYTGVLNMQATALPEWDTSVSWQTMATSGHLENSVSVAIGDATRTQVHTIDVQEIIDYKGHLWNNTAEANFKISYPQKDINYALSVKHENTDNRLKNAIELQYAMSRKISTSLDLSVNTENPMFFNGDAKVRYPGREARVSAQFSEGKSRDYRVAASVQWQRGQSASVMTQYRDKSDNDMLKYEADGEISFSTKSPITFSGSVGAQRGQYFSSAELNTGLDKYKLNLEYIQGNGFNHKLLGQLLLRTEIYSTEVTLKNYQDKYTGNFELKLPTRRRITANADIKTSSTLKTASVEAMWDADRDRAKRFGAEGEIRVNARGYDGKFNVQIQRQNIKGFVTTSRDGQLFGRYLNSLYSGEVEWSSNQKVTFSLTTNMLLASARHQLSTLLRLTTPFEGYEIVAFNIKHSEQNHEWTSEMFAELGQQQRYFVFTDGKYLFGRDGASLTANLGIRSPVRNFESLVFNLTHFHDSVELSNKLLLQWNDGPKIATHVYRLPTESGVRAGGRLTTPYSMLSDVAAEVTHNFVSGSYKTRGELQWAPDKKVNVVIDSRHVLSGRRSMCSLSVLAISPFRGYETLSWKTVYNYDGSALNTDTEFHWNGKKLTAGISGLYKNLHYGSNVEGKLFFNSPFESFDSLQIATALQSMPDNFKFNIDMHLPYHNTLTFNTQGKLVSLKNIEFNALVSGRLPGFRDMLKLSIDVVHKLQNSNLRSTFDVMYGNKQTTILLTGLTKPGYKSLDLEGSLMIKTPFRGFEEVKLDLMHNQRDWEFTTRTQMNRNRESLLLIHELNVKDRLNFESSLQLTSYMTGVSNVKASVLQTYNPGYFTHNTNIQLNSNQDIILTINYQDKIPTKEFAVTLDTPYRTLKNFALLAEHKSGRTEYKSKVKMNWNGKEKLSVESEIKNYRMRKGEAEITLTSSIYSEQSYMFTGQFDTFSPKKTIDANFEWNRKENRAVSVTGSLSLNSESPQFDLVVKSPFRDFERISITGEATNKPYDKSMSLSYERDGRKIKAKGKFEGDAEKFKFDIGFKSPFQHVKDMRVLLNYRNGDQDISAEALAQLDDTRKVTVSGELSQGDERIDAKLSLETPLIKHGHYGLEFSADLSQKKRVANIEAKWAGNKAELSAECEVTRGRSGKFKIQVKSPFKNYEKVVATSRYSNEFGKVEGNVKVDIGKGTSYTGEMAYINDNSLTVRVITPHQPFRNSELNVLLNNDANHSGVEAKLKWENNEISTVASFVYSGTKFSEVMFKLNTPFQSFRSFELDTYLKTRGQTMDGRLSMLTPFEALPKLDMIVEFRPEANKYDALFKVETVSRSLSVTGQISKSLSKPIDASLTIDAPFTSFKNIAFITNIDFTGGLSASRLRARVVTPRSLHTVFMEMTSAATAYDMEFTIESPILPHRKFSLTGKFDNANYRRIALQLTANLMDETHNFDATYNQQGPNSNFEAVLNSPWLPQKTSTLKGAYLEKRQGKNIEFRIEFTPASETQQIAIVLENEKHMASAEITIDSSFLSSSVIKLTGKYVNVHNRDIELSSTFAFQDEEHTLVISLKNYDQEKFFQLKTTCPNRRFSITGTLRNDNYNALDAVLTVNTMKDEFRIAANMQRTRWERVEAFLTVNTPFEPLRMVRVDAGYKNDKYQNFEGNVQLETSHKKYSSMGVTAKLSRNKGSEDVSVVVHLPNKNYRTVQLLGNVHYNAEMSTADAKFTLSVPPKRYSVFGHYVIERNGLAVDGEVEWETKKWSSFLQAKGQGYYDGQVVASLSIPDKGTYTAGTSSKEENGRYSLSVSYTVPFQQPFTANITVDYRSLLNLNVVLDATTPFVNYRQIHLRLQHKKSGRVQWFASGELEVNNVRMFMNYFRRANSTDYMNSVRLGTPYRSVRQLEFTFVSNANGGKRSLDVMRNGQNAMKVEVMSFRGQKHLLLDIPAVPLTLSARQSSRDSVHDIVVKSNYATRSMSFNSAFQNVPGYWSHEAVLVWDEAAKKSVSSALKLTDTSNGKMNGKEILARVNFPLRSVEMKGKLTESGRMRSGGIHLYWDAARDTNKYMSVGVEHQNLSSRNQISHKVQITISHPSFPRDVSQTSTLIIKPSEVLARSELQYSRHNEHDFIAEVKANDLSQGDTRYQAELNVRHPVSQLDLKMAGEFINSREETTANLKLKDMNERRRQVVRELTAKILKLRKQIELTAKSEENKYSVIGRMSEHRDSMVFALDQKTNEREQFQSLLHFHPKRKALNMNITLAGNSGLQLSASFPEDSASFKLSHYSDVSAVTDAYVLIGLEKSRILTSRVNWRPGMWRDFRIATGDAFRTVSYSLSTAANTASAQLGEEVSSKMNSMNQAMSGYMTPFLQSVSDDMQAISEDIADMLDQLKFMYRNNEFYVRDAVETTKLVGRSLKQFFYTASAVAEVLKNIVLEYLDDVYYNIFFVVEDICVYLDKLHDKMSNVFSDLTKAGLDGISSLCASICETATDVLERFNLILQQLGDKALSRLDSLIKSYAPFIIDTYYFIRINTDRIRNSVNDAVTAATNHPLYLAIRTYWFRIKSTVEAFEVADLTSSLQSRVLFLGEKASLFMNRLSDVQLVNIIRNKVPIEAIARATFQKSIDLYAILGINRLVDYGTEYVKNMLLSSGNELLQEFYQLKNNLKYDFDPKRGSFSFEYTLPSARNNIYDVFDFAKYMEHQKLSELKEVLLKKYYDDFCAWDLYYRIRNFLNLRSWMPPFSGHAMIAGNQHFVTFDKFSFDFAGECSYLLTRDFVDGNFTVVANYRKDGQRVLRKSITVITNLNKIDVSHDYKVTLDDIKVELPIRAGDTVVIRDGITVRVENERRGFVLVCNFVHDVCTVGISGFYFGKTGGLFGTYDNEPKLDMMTPQRTLARDIESFVNSWEVSSGSCKRTENYATIPGNDLRVQNKCKALFEKTSSSFRPCLKQVDPEPYLKMCISDLSFVPENKFDTAICTSAAAYFTECSIAGVLLKMPTSCIRCERDDAKPLLEGEATKFSNHHHSTAADVVFIVEEKQCNQENFKFLGKLAHSIEDNFRQKGFTDIHYKVVGFGGDDIHAKPHIHTIDGQEYGSIRAVDSAFQSLQVGEGPANMLEALRYAASLNYRLGSTKTFVLVKCSTCKVHENKAAYGEMLRTLLDGDISLHLLMEQKYEMKISNKNSKAKKVIGLDKNFAYTLKDVKDSNLLGDGDLQMQLKVPKDICVSLALEVNGSTFDSQYLTETKRSTYKKFMDVLARRMVKSAKQKPEWTMCCECIATTQGAGKSACQRCVSAEVVNMITDDDSTYFTTKEEVDERKSKSDFRQKPRRTSEKKRRSN